MTDYFALLNQPRRPWLDAEQLKQAFHAKALRLHPDGQRAGAAGDTEFAELNDAYQTLQHPKQRLQHLLTLSGSPPARAPATTPQEIAELFTAVAGVTQRIGEYRQRSAIATTALSRSLLKPQLLELTAQLNHTSQRVSELNDIAVRHLQQLDRAWTNGGDHLAELQDLYVRLAYLSRWAAELTEQRLQLDQL